MRIFLLGDPQYRRGEASRLKAVGRDIASLSPDLTVVLGDYGTGRDYGKGTGFKKVLRHMGPFPPGTQFMLGNHDVQGEAGERYVKRGTVGKKYVKAFGKKPENQFLEFSDFRLFVINLDIQPAWHYSTRGECFVTEEHFHEIELKIQERPGVPVVMVTHAPPVGTDLATVPESHIRATNAYMDQFNLPEKWMRLYKEHREIVLWFSGHYHLGHEVAGTIAFSSHTVFALTGVATSASRTGSRHSRVLDISAEEVRISTYDHASHSLLEAPDYHHDGPLSSLMEESYPESDTFKAGKGRLLSVTGNGDRLYALTEGNYVWEIIPRLRACMGTLSNSSSPEVLAIKAEKDYVWLYTRDCRYGACYTSPRRFKNKLNNPDLAKERYTGPLPENNTGTVTLPDGNSYEVTNGIGDDQLHIRRL